MTPEHIQKAIHDGIAAALANQLQPAVQTAVDAAVNGKITKLAHDVAPLVTVYNSYLSWKKGAIIWVGILLAIGGFIQAVQAIWSLTTHYVVLK